MALLAIEGLYKDGRVELQETPTEVTEARVMVVFLPPEALPEAQTVSPDEEQRRAAAARVIERMKKGYHLGGERPYQKREELYDRFDRDR
jgi:hypothetical protein